MSIYDPPQNPPRPDRKRDPVFIWPVPEKADYLFWVEMDMKLPANQSFTYGDAPTGSIANYTDHKLVYVTPQDANNISRWFYASNRTNEDNYNFEFSSVDMGGRRFDTVTRHYLVPREDFSESLPAAGAAMPTGPSGKFTGLGYVLMSRGQKRTDDQTFDSLFVIEQRVYVKKVTISQLGFDETSRANLASVSTWFYRGEEVTAGVTVETVFSDPGHSYWDAGITVSGGEGIGYVREGQQLSDDWFVVTQRQVIRGAHSGGVITVDDYETTVNYFWPPVLSVLEFMDWDRVDGGVDIFPRVEFDPEGYSGPCNATVVRTWKPTKFTGLTTEQMNPRGIYYSSPFFRLNIPPCLHTQQSAVCDIGNTDPVYDENVGSSRCYPPTNYTSWPATIVAEDDQTSFRGGFLRTTLTVSKPDSDHDECV